MKFTNTSGDWLPFYLFLMSFTLVRGHLYQISVSNTSWPNNIFVNVPRGLEKNAWPVMVGASHLQGPPAHLCHLISSSPGCPTCPSLRSSPQLPSAWNIPLHSSPLGSSVTSMSRLPFLICPGGTDHRLFSGLLQQHYHWSPCFQPSPREAITQQEMANITP